MRYEKIYQKLKAKYTDEEIVDSTFIPADLTKREKEELEEEMKHIRLKKLAETSDQDRILADVMRLRIQIEDYLKKGVFSFEHTFGKFLAEYIRIVKRTRKETSNDLAIHYTKLSRIINDKEEPNIELAYRLEKHSASLIESELWWKLMIRKQEFIISEDKETKEAEQQKVKNYLKRA
ncbi:MAG: hypothetical protein AAF573_00725 [Bacteroidota bacterium]